MSYEICAWLCSLISAIYDLMKDQGLTIDDVYNAVISLFPNMRKGEKRQVYDYVASDQNDNDFKYSNRTKCGEWYYTDERLKIHFPSQDARVLAIENYARLMTPDGRNGMDLYNADSKLKSVMVCSYCPQLECCRNSIFGIDQENDND